MLMENILILSLNFVVVVTFSIGNTNTRDPVCSKYDFEEKVLEKLVRIEHRIELYEEKMKLWEKDITSKIEKLDENERKVFHDVKATVNSEIEKLKLSMSDVVSNVTSEVSVVSQNLSKEIDIQRTAIQVQVSTKLATVDTIEMQISELINSTRLEQKLMSTGILNLTEALKSRINDQLEKVAVTSCVSASSTRSGGVILKFDDVKTEIGINQLSAFKTSGKFTCEKDGLYQVSVFIATHTSGSVYSIYKNGNCVSKIYANHSPSTYIHTGTGVVAVVLQVGDTVWVQTGTSMYVCDTYSCITIVKIK